MIFTSDELLSKVVNLLPRCPLVRYVVYFSNGVIQKYTHSAIEDLSRLNMTARESVEAAREVVPPGVHLYDILELEARGREVIVAEAAAAGTKPAYNYWKPPADEWPTAQDLAIIMYTSGSTGQPP